MRAGIPFQCPAVTVGRRLVARSRSNAGDVVAAHPADRGEIAGDQNLGALDGERPDRSVGAHASIEQAVDQALTARESASSQPLRQRVEAGREICSCAGATPCRAKQNHQEHYQRGGCNCGDYLPPSRLLSASANASALALRREEAHQLVGHYGIGPDDKPARATTSFLPCANPGSPAFAIGIPARGGGGCYSRDSPVLRSSATMRLT